MEDDTNIRRVSSKDRKQRIKAEGPLFPEDSKPHRRPPEQRPIKRGPARIYNLITVLFLIATIGVMIYVGIIFTNPYSALNPLPPNTPIPQIITATPTDTPAGVMTPEATSAPEN
jgi:hypothetical protein